MAKHKKNFPNIWTYLEDSGLRATTTFKSFDMFGRRRILPEPTWERAKEFLLENEPEKFILPEEDQEEIKNTFLIMNKRPATEEELKKLIYRSPTSDEIVKKLKGMTGNISRQGKNHRIQSANATIIKLAISSKFDKDGKPYFWHILPKYDSKLVKMVHDELVILVPAIYAEIVANEAADCIKRAAAVKMKHIVMESEFHISNCWEK
jgi:DNA polymerase I-like protein with 3'-5' exonuclease and polymerase domains